MTELKKFKSGNFQGFGLDKEILNGLSRMGYHQTTPVQRKALPVALAGLDLVCMARTGSGKTCVFLLPMIQKLKQHRTNAGLRGLVLSPTRELALQTFRFSKDMAKFTDLRIISIIGGDPIEGQFESLSNRPDIIIATPGRLMHHLQEVATFSLKSIEYLVFDEADRLFEMGFAEQLNEIVRECPIERQTLLFSATIPKMLLQFSRAGLRDPQLIRLDTDIKMSEELRMAFFCTRSNEKLAALLYLVKKIIPSDQLTIIFTATRHHSELIFAMLKCIGVMSSVVYGTMDQDARSENLRLFREGHVNYLVVTDLAARGIDIPLLNNVINFHFPPSPKLFVHRCGRAARQGRIGYAFSIVDPEEMAYMVDVHLFLGKNISIGNHDASCEPKSLDDKIDRDNGETIYDLSSMTPEQVHTGILPQDIIDQENDFIKRTLAGDDMLSTCWRISENGMKQYKRTRTEPTREGLKFSKVLLKSHHIDSMIHPLIKGCDPLRSNKLVEEKANYVRMLQTFRPSQTILETGIGTGMSHLGKRDRGVMSSSASSQALAQANKEAKGVEIMKAMRKANRIGLIRNNTGGDILCSKELLHALVNKGSIDTKNDEDDGDEGKELDEFNEGASLDDHEILPEDYSEIDKDIHEESPDSLDHSSMMKQSKPRLSIAERKRRRKSLTSDNQVDGPTAITTRESSPGSSREGSNNFKDEKYYMKYGTEDSTVQFSESSMQPQNGLRSSENHNAARLEQAILDVAPDEAIELNKKKRIMRWDAKKRKFVKQSMEEISNLKSNNKRMRSESGMHMTTSDRPKGEMYKKWQKKTHKIIGGVMNEDDDDHTFQQKSPNYKINTKAKDELKNNQEIKKLKTNREKNKLKNMEKGKRSKIEEKNRKQKKLSQNGVVNKYSLNARNRKSKVIIKY